METDDVPVNQGTKPAGRRPAPRRPLGWTSIIPAHTMQPPNNDAEIGMREHFIQATTRTETKVELLTESLRELKRAIEELIDRVDADIDTLRTKAEGYSVVASKVKDLEDRQREQAAKIEGQDAKIQTLQHRLWWASGVIAGITWLLTMVVHKP